MRELRLAVDARVLGHDTRGIGRYERAILRRFVRRDDVAVTLLNFGPFSGRYRGVYERALDSDRFDVAARAGAGHDVVWHPANGTFFPSSRPNVVTIHDAVPFREPNADPKARAREQRPFLDSIASAARIVAVSQFGKSEVADVFGVPPERISVIYHGVEPSFSPAEQGPLPAGAGARPYVLFVGDATEPRKNFGVLYDAFRSAWPSTDGPQLVVAGPRAPQLPGVVHAGEVKDDLQETGNAQMRSLYRGALALALVSRHETFGMPAIEAMACGTPVIASSASCLPEICADAAFFAPFDDCRAWSEQLKRVAGDADLRAEFRARGLRRAEHFNWDRSAEAHLEVLRSVAES